MGSVAVLATFHYRDASAPRPNGPLRVGVIALIQRDGELLLERRVDAPLWSLIGGAVEEDEPLVDALKREVYEETGLVPASQSLFGTFSDPTRILAYDDGNVHRIVTVAYEVVVSDFKGLRASDESESLAFFALDDLGSLDMPATQRPIVERLRSTTRPPYLD